MEESDLPALEPGRLPFKQLTEAPRIGRLSELKRQWAWVGTIQGQIRVWFGDLNNRHVKRAYETMVQEGDIIATQYRMGAGHYKIFAKMADPALAPDPKRRAVL